MKKKNSFETIFEAFAFIPQLALSFAVPVFLGAVAGNWLDDQMGTGSVLFIGLGLLGIGGGAFAAYQLFMTISKKK